MAQVRHVASAPQAQQELTAAREEVAMLRQAAAADEQGDEMLAELDALKSARAEIAALRSAIQQVGCALTRAAAAVCLAPLRPCSVSAHLSTHGLQPLALQAGQVCSGRLYVGTVRRTSASRRMLEIMQVARTTMTALEGEVAASIDSPSHPAAFLDVGAETPTAANGSRA
jgi:hypothetical protein